MIPIKAISESYFMLTELSKRTPVELNEMLINPRYVISVEPRCYTSIKGVELGVIVLDGIEKRELVVPAEDIARIFQASCKAKADGEQL